MLRETSDSRFPLAIKITGVLRVLEIDQMILLSLRRRKEEAIAKIVTEWYKDRYATCLISRHDLFIF